MSLKKYRSYKDSGVEWLGEVPEHWGIKKFKHIFDLYTGNSLNDEQKKIYNSENGIPYISSKDINLETRIVNYENGMRIPKIEKHLKTAPKGSWLLCIEGGSAGKKIVYLEQEVCFVNKLCCFRSSSNSKFQYYFAQSQGFSDKFKLSISGLIGGVSVNTLSNFKMLFPPLSEQTTITTFLDRETTKIDTLIAEKQRLIELLKEKRQAVISHAVTKGLDPNAPMKDSGVEWLGKIPKHWKLCKFRYTFSESSEKIQDTIVGQMLSVSGYRGIEIKEYDDENRQRLDEDLVSYRIVRIGQLVVNTMWLNYAGLGVSNFEGHVSPAYRSYWISKEMNKQFVHYLMRSNIYVQGYTKFLKGIRPNSLQMSREDLMSFPILTPTLNEQTAITTFLDRETTKIDTLITEANKALSLLKERRSSLISAAVTGKIDVRHLAPQEAL